MDKRPIGRVTGSSRLDFSSQEEKMKKIVVLTLVMVLAGTMVFGQFRGRAGEPSIYMIAKTTPGFEILAAALEAAGVERAFDGNRHFTVFAPTNEAFQELLDELGLSAAELLADKSLLTAVLLYHVTRGDRYAAGLVASGFARMLDGNGASISTEDGQAYINDSRIVAVNIRARNGLVHVIDKVLLPPTDGIWARGRAGEPSIYQIAKTTPGFGILAAALEAAGLEETFDGSRHFTVFAPTDDAFVALLGELGLSAEELLEDKETLTAVLLYHVTRGSRFAQALLASGSVRMLDGNGASITTEQGQAYINDSKIVEVNIRARNGVVHVIDQVLLPPAE
jgi:transforming growth factor-beta-induced protein